MTTLRLGPLKGLLMPLDLSTTDRHVWLNSYEPWVQKSLVEVLRPGMVVWDIWAFIGYYVALASRMTRGQVLAVEPDSDNIRRIERTIAANELKDITVEAAAVGAAEGRGSFATSGTTPASKSGTLAHVPVTTLDLLAAKYGPPDLIVMDIEGGEVDAIRGGSKVLSETRPQLAVDLYGAAGVLAANQLADLGYNLVTRAGISIHVQMRTVPRVHALATAEGGKGR